jgi:hypothetical protein
MCAASWIKNRAAIAVLLIFWIVVSSQNGKIFEYLQIAGFETTRISFMTNLSLLDYGDHLEDFVGGPAREFARWATKGSYLLWLLILYIVSVIHANRSALMGRKTLPWRPVLAFVLVVPMLFGLYNGFGYFYDWYCSSFRNVLYRDAYYPAWGDPIPLTDLTVSRDDNVTVLANDIKFSTTLTGMAVQCRLTLRANKDISGQIFTLDRNFRVSNVSQNGQPVPYTQSRDALWVEFPGGMQKGEQADLTFTYGGMSAPQFKANYYTVQLGSLPLAPLAGPSKRQRTDIYDDGV